MPWPLTLQMDVALKDKIVRPVILYAMNHPRGWVRIWSGVGKVTWVEGDLTVPGTAGIYFGAGILLSASATEQSTEVQVQTHTFQIAGLDFDQIDYPIKDILAQGLRRCPIYSWKALLDETGQIIPHPRGRFRGYADSPQLMENNDGTRTIQISIESSLFNLVAPVQTQISHETQIAKYPGDNGLSLMSSIPNQQVVWDIGAYNNFTPPA